MAPGFAGTAEQLTERLKELEERFPGLEHISLGMPICAPKTKMMEIYQQVGEEVMPHFSG